MSARTTSWSCTFPAVRAWCAELFDLLLGPSASIPFFCLCAALHGIGKAGIKSCVNVKGHAYLCPAGFSKSQMCYPETKHALYFRANSVVAN